MGITNAANNAANNNATVNNAGLRAQQQEPTIAQVENGVPANVKAAGPETIAFTMKTGAGNVPMTWNKQDDKLFVNGKEASPALKDAVLKRLSADDLKATRKGSTYDQMRVDMLEKKPATKAETTTTTAAATTTKQREPEMPSTVKTDDLYASNAMSREEFVKAMGDKSVDARLAPKADLNADGVIKGKDEQSALFSELERNDKNGDKNVADLTDKKTKAAIDSALAAKDAGPGKASYSAKQLDRMSEALENGTPGQSIAQFVKPGTKDYLGRKLRDDAVEVPVTEGAGKGVTVVHDRKLGFMKANPEGGPLVPMTKQDVQKLAADMKDAGKPGDDATPAYKVLWNRMFPKDQVVVSEECST